MKSKIRVSQVLKQFPFLSDLIKKTDWSNQAYCTLEFRVDMPVELQAPFHDGCVRYTSLGKIEKGKLAVKSNYAGSYESCLNNPVEILGQGLEDKIIKPGCFYAVADSFEFWRSRHITVWMRTEQYKLLELKK
jgi:hypothetical protein